MRSNRSNLLKGYQNPIYEVDLSSYTLVSLFEEIARRIPLEIAIVHEGEQIAYSQVNQKANQIARALLEFDDSHPQTIAALADNGSKMNFMELGILKARKILVGLLPSQPIQRLAATITDSGARILVHASENLDLAQELASQSELTLLNIDQLENVPGENLQLAYLPEDLVTIVYTSGSTGKPKGISKNNLAILHSVAVNAAIGLNETDRFLSIYHFSYANGTTALFKAWLVGGILFPFDLNQKGLTAMVELIKQQEITLYHSPPSLYRNFVALISPAELPSIRRVHLGGEPVQVRDIELFKEKFLEGSIIYNNLGSSEAPSLMRFLMDHSTDLEGEIVPVGFPTDRTKLSVLDEGGNQVELGETGELVVHSQYLASGYWNDPKLTAEKFLIVNGNPEKTFYTGDLVYQRPDGCYIYAGRKDSQVKVRGSRVVVAELEALISRISGISQAAVRVDQSSGNAVHLHAFVIPEPETDVTPGELRRTLARTLPIHMVPHQVSMLNEFPRTSSGKIDRKALPIKDSQRPALENPFEPPATDTEKVLTKVWENIFQIDGIGVTDNFFDLGGDSLQAVELFVEIEKNFSRRFPISLLVQASNIRQQAGLVEAIQNKDPWLPLVEFNSRGEQLPLFCFAGKGGNPIKFREMALRLGDDQPVYFLQSRGLSGQEPLFTSVEAMASDYLQAIRQVQPSGPYRLLGSSFGGKVAYEVASQLSEQSETVDFVMMLDTYATGYPKYIKTRPKYILKARAGIDYLKKHWQSLQHGNRGERLTYLKYYWDLIPVMFEDRKRKHQEKLEAEERQRALPEALRLVEKTNIRASSRYQPRPFLGKVVLLRALEQPKDIVEDKALGWGRVDIGELIIHPVNGHHGNLLMPPHVSQVVDLLKLYLDGNTE